jgi:UDP-glucose 4-epimerase
MKVLLTGGLGYIGSHICVELLKCNYQIVVVDNLVNSSELAIKRVALITKKSLSTNIKDDSEIIFCNSDIRHRDTLRAIFNYHNIDSVIHLAGYKSISESIQNPIEYYNNNLFGSIVLIEEMMNAGVKKIIFSSSACVYGNPENVPVDESFPVDGSSNPYAHSKLIIEDMLKSIYMSNQSWSISLLRYFNPVGAHSSGLLGEDPKGIPNNLMPYIVQVAIGKRDKLKIFGDNYPTEDGTGIRDYIHVVDLAKGHLAALKFQAIENKRFDIFNLGTGKGVSVLEMVRAFERACQITIPYEIVDRRDGDIAECWASIEYVKQKIGWSALHDINKMCEDAWRWQQKNPEGYSI